MKIMEYGVLDVCTQSLKKLSKKYGISINDLGDQLAKGIEVEKEHTTDPMVAAEIALDHLNELPDYYDRLEKVESDETL